MQIPTPQPYARLRQRLEDWNAARPVQPPDAAPLREFLLTVHERLLPELKTLARLLEEAGLHCDVFHGEGENPTVGIRMESVHAILRLSPASPIYLRAVVASGHRPNDEIEWFIPFHLIRKGGLERELQAAMLNLLTRCRARQ